jgi:hypothetical protein
LEGVLIGVTNVPVPDPFPAHEEKAREKNSFLHMEVSMPPVSQAQRRAMYAATAGHSTLGIPQKVGAEFVAADPGGKLPGKVKFGRKAPFGKFGGGGKAHKAPKLRIGNKTYGD